MTDNDIELKACPFCGGHGSIKQEDESMLAVNSHPLLEETTDGWWRVICYFCGASVSHPDKSVAVQRWNNRPPQFQIKGKTMVTRGRMIAIHPARITSHCGIDQIDEFLEQNKKRIVICFCANQKTLEFLSLRILFVAANGNSLPQSEFLLAKVMLTGYVNTFDPDKPVIPFRADETVPNDFLLVIENAD